MGYPQSYNGTVPFGKMAIAAAGTTTPLSANCGSFGGQTIGTNYLNPPVPGATAQQFTIQADQANSGNLYLLPRGKTAAGNPASIMVQIPPGGAVTFPVGLTGPGLQPENFVLDTDAVSGTQNAYGYATLNG